jgi:hypothetical protein
MFDIWIGLPAGGIAEKIIASLATSQARWRGTVGSSPFR